MGESGQGVHGIAVFVTFSVNHAVLQEKKWFENVCLDFRQR